MPAASAQRPLPAARRAAVKRSGQTQRSNAAVKRSAQDRSNALRWSNVLLAIPNPARAPRARAAPLPSSPEPRRSRIRSWASLMPWSAGANSQRARRTCAAPAVGPARRAAAGGGARARGEGCGSFETGGIDALGSIEDALKLRGAGSASDLYGAGEGARPICTEGGGGASDLYGGGEGGGRVRFVRREPVLGRVAHRRVKRVDARRPRGRGPPPRPPGAATQVPTVHTRWCQ
jgi:hypothetical protein